MNFDFLQSKTGLIFLANCQIIQSDKTVSVRCGLAHFGLQLKSAIALYSPLAQYIGRLIPPDEVQAIATHITFSAPFDDLCFDLEDFQCQLL